MNRLLTIILLAYLANLSYQNDLTHLTYSNQLQELNSSSSKLGRQLAICFFKSCTCTDPHATQCWWDLLCKNCYVWKCVDGYVNKDWKSTTCVQCAGTIPNCNKCTIQQGSTSTSCSVCNPGYTAMASGCVVCPLGCSTCSTVLVNKIQKASCTGCSPTLSIQISGSLQTCGCLPSQYLVTSVTPNVCANCSSLCLTCSDATTCKSCNVGYYLQGTTCLACMPVCKTCSDAVTCLTCQSSTQTLSGNVCVCASTLFYDTNTKSCLSCSSLQANCASCSYATTYNATNPPAVSCTTANPGYYLINGVATPCMSYCSNCDPNGTSCVTPNTNFIYNGTSCICDVGFYFLSSSSTCQTCEATIIGCVACQTNIIPNSTQCTACNTTGYFSLVYPTLTCSPCSSLCLACNNGTNCSTCDSNLQVIEGLCGCNSTLNLFYDPLSTSCVACSSVFFNCQTCNATLTSTYCAQCSPGFYSTNDNQTCVSCPLTCSACLNSSFCSSCQAGYELDLTNTTCICSTNCTTCMTNSPDGLCSSCILSPFACNSCLTGFILNASNLCSSCNITWNSCIQCSASVCLSCESQFILSSSGCICNNTAGDYLSFDSTQCQSCSVIISNCLICSNNISTICSNCSIGYYVANSSQSCLACSGYCLTCSTSATSCESCLPTFSLMSANSCSCNNTAGYYYDPSIVGCNLCSTIISKCQVCSVNSSNLTQCSTCADTYYWNSTTFTCEACSSSCKNCSTLGVCTSCPNGFILSQTIGLTPSGQCVCDNSTNSSLYYDQISGTCQSCSYFYPSCSNCSYGNSVICTNCSGSTYLLNGTCINCPLSCATCSDANTCLSCPVNLTLSNGACICDSLCSQCQALSIGCISCLITSGAITNCYSCEAGTYLVSPNCQSCPSTCVTCSSSTVCLTCVSSYVLINGMCSCATALEIYADSTGVCKVCSEIYYGCTQCALVGGATACITCTEGYYVSGNQCSVCNTSCSACQLSPSNCTSCVLGQTLVNNTCSCTSSSCIACSNISPGCAQCVYTIYGNFSKCGIALPGYYIDGNSCALCPSICVTCGTNGVCLSCADTYQIINGTCMCNQGQNMWQSSNLCLACTTLYPNCQTCNQNTSAPSNVSCSQCNTNYYLSNNTCTASICGDNIITSGETCDDGNTNSKDGCDKYCQIQINYLCTGQPSVCIINVNFNISLSKIETNKHICNRVSMSFTISPVYDSYNTANFFPFLDYIDLPYFIFNGWSYSRGVVTYDLEYTSSVDGLDLTIYFAPAALSINQTVNYPRKAITFLIASNNNIPVMYFNSSICQQKALMQGLASAVLYLSYGTLAISAFPSRIIGLELFGVLQLAHLNVGNMDNISTMLIPLMEMNGVQGFSLNLGDQEKTDKRLLQASSYTPERVDSIGYESNFLRNCNIMLMLVLAVILFSTVLYLATYFCKSCAPSLHSISKRIIKQVLLTLILFNCFNFAYSAGLHFSYAPQSDGLYTLGTIAAVLAIVLPFLMAIGLVCADNEGFGQYKQKFKPGVVQKSYFVVTIFYRSGIGLYISTMNQDQLSTLLVMGLSIAFLLYNLINLPYTKAYHNYRANICHFTQFVSLFVTMYYRSMMSTTSTQQLSTIFTPVYLQICCIIISLVVSIVVLVYEIYLFIKQCLEKSKKEKQESRQNQQKQHIIQHIDKINNSQADIEGQVNKEKLSIDQYEWNE